MPAGQSAGLAGRRPQREVGHARQLRETGPGQALQALDHGIEQHAKDTRALGLERRPKFGLRTAALLGDRLQRQEDRSIGEVGPGHDVLDAVQDHRPGGVEQHLVLIGIQLAHGEAAAGRETAERVGNPRRQARHVVEGQHMAVGGGDEQVAVLARQGAQGRGVGIEQRPKDRARRSTSPIPARPTARSPDRDHDCARTASAQDDHQHEVGIGLDIEERRSASIDPPRAGIGKGFMPEARRKRTGGLSITRQPEASISIARQVSSQRSR